MCAAQGKVDSAFCGPWRGYCNLAFEVDAPGFVGRQDVVARPQERVRAALVHERIGPEAFGHFGAARLAHEFHVIDVR